MLEFPLSIKKGIPTIFSDRIETFKANDMEWNQGNPWTARQAAFVLLFLPRLSTVSLEFDLDYKDAKVIKSNIADLLKSKRVSSKVKKALIFIRVIGHKQSSTFFNADQTIATFLSIFDK